MAIEKTKETTRSKQAAKTKAKIFKTAISLFTRYGYQNVTVSDICKKADVSVGVFYHYFEGKSSVVVEMVRRRDRSLKENFTDNEALPAGQRLIELLKYYAHITADIGVESIRVLYNPENIVRQESAGGPRDDVGEIVYLIRSIVEDGVKKGELLEEKEYGKTTYYLAVALRGLIYDWCRSGGDYSLETVVEEYFSMLLRLFVD